jgi:hypothetical protein
MPHTDPALLAIIDDAQRLLDHAYQPIGEVRAHFDRRCAALEPAPSKQAASEAWREVVGQVAPPNLLAVQTVARASTTGQVSLHRGDVFSLPADQWLCSAFHDSVSPTGGVWRSFWQAAARHGPSWTERQSHPPAPLDPDGQIALVDTCPGRTDGLPTIVLFGRYSPRERAAHQWGSPEDWPERVYFDGLLAARGLARRGQLGRRIAMPVLFSELHGVPYDRAIELQRAFALDLVRQEEGVQEVLISVLDDDDAQRLVQAWHLAAGDPHATLSDPLICWS